MRVEIFLILSLGVFFLLHFVVLRSMFKSIQKDRSAQSISRHGMYRLVSLARLASLVSALVAFALLVCFYALDFWGGLAPANLEQAILIFKACRNILLQLSTGWVVTGCVLLVAGLAVHAYLRGKRQMKEALSRIVQNQVDEIVKKMNSGTLEPLPLNTPLQQVLTAMEQNHFIRNHVESDSSLDETTRTKQLLHIDASNRKLEGLYINLEIDRRIDAKLPESEVALPKPSGFWSRIQTALISEGLIRTQGVTSRFVYAALLAVLIPSFLVFYGTPAAGSLDQKMIALNELRLSLNADAADQEFQAALGKPADAAELTAEDQAILRRVAGSLEEASLTANDVGIRPLASSVTFALRATAARQQILTATAAHSGGVFEATPRISSLQTLPKLEQQLVSLTESSGKSPKPASPIGESLYGKLEAAARQDRGLVSRLRAELATFQKPVHQQDLTAGLLGDVLDNQKPSRLTAREQGLMKNLHGARTTRAVSELAFRDASLQQAIELAKAPDRICATLDTPDLIQLRTKLQIVSQEGDLAAKQLVTRVREVHPPSTVAKQTVNWDEARAVKAVNNLRSGAGKLAGTPMQQPHQLADVFATYSDYFPGHLGEEARSLRGRLLSNWNPETVKAPAGKTNFLRSRSFNGLRGFSRVGGVLIGRDPIEATNAASDQANHSKLELPCRDIQWQWTQDGLRMVLIDEKGQSHVTRSHRLRIVQQALSYAADGRPLAVTIINTKPLPFRQVLLHPTLVDSPLGYRMNELDQFVYRYASDRSEFQSRTEIWEGHLLLYVVARAVRLGQIKDASIFTPEARELITASRAEAALQLEKALDANLPFREQLAKSLVDSTSLRDPRRSPLPGMSDYFDASLVQWIQKAVDATDDPATFTSLIEHEAEAQWTELASASRDLEEGLRKVEAGLSFSEPERLRYVGLEKKIQASAKAIFNWVIPAPTWSEVSGVREAPFSLKLSDLIVREGQDVPKHFLTFTVQLAFTSPAYFSSEEETSLPEPWEYEELKPLIEREVAEGIATDAVNQEILADALEFTLLQRLFRMALTGRLGEDFPCEKLAVLAEELAERIPTHKYPTQRWDYAGLEMPVSASAELHLVQGLLAKFDLLPEELLGGEMKAADMQKLAEALNGIESKLSEHKDIADQDRAAVTQGVLLLKRRLEQLAPCMQQAEAIKSGPQPRDRAQLESAWEKHLAPESWWKDWENLAIPPVADRDLPVDIAEALQLLATAHDLLSLQQSLGITDDAKQALFRAVLEEGQMPPLQ